MEPEREPRAVLDGPMTDDGLGPCSEFGRMHFS